MQSTPHILIVMALPMENVGNQLDAFGEIIYTGIGKVNAALHLTERLSQAVAGQAKRPDLVINLGSAGAQQRPTGSILACTRFVQRDMQLLALGYAWGQTPFEEYDSIEMPLPLGWQALGLTEAVCYTGDQFVTEPHPFFELDVVDMEGYALARVCKHFDVPLLSLKFITDGADGQAGNDWQEALAEATRALRQVMGQAVQLGLC